MPLPMSIRQENAAKWAHQKVLVAGLARSGIAAAGLLLRCGAEPYLYDQKPASAFKQEFDNLGIAENRLFLGGDPFKALDEVQSLVISPGIPIQSPLVLEALKRGIPVVGEMELAFSLTDIPIYAITGTNGKTTTTQLLSRMFEESGIKAPSVGNIGYPLSQALLEYQNVHAFVCEASSFQLESSSSFHPCSAALLNITPDHLDRHGNMQEYSRLKRSIFSYMNSGDFAVLNEDDPLVSAFGTGIKAGILRFSHQKEIEQGAFIRDKRIVFRAAQVEQTVCEVDQILIPGLHNLENALAAVCMAYSAGIPFQAQAAALQKFKGAEHRTEKVGVNARGVVFTNDSKGTNPDSTIKAINALKRPAVVIMGGADKQTPFDLLANAIKDSPYVRAAVLIGQTSPLIEAALKAVCFETVSCADSLEEAILKAAQQAEQDGEVLFSPACSSFDMFKSYEERGRVFKQIVRETQGISDAQ